jgi:hypothetical protein
MVIFGFADDYNATKNADDLGLDYVDYNFLMAQVGILIGFVILWFSIQISLPKR